MKKASALILAVLIMGLIGIVSAGVSRLSIEETKMSLSSTDSDIAYYLAEAGLEHGLLKLRYNKNFEQAAGLTNYVRYFLNKIGNNPDTNNPPVAANPYGGNPYPTYSSLYLEPYYDLKISYQKPYIGCDDAGGGSINQNDLKVSNYPICATGYTYKSKTPQELFALNQDELSVGYDISKIIKTSVTVPDINLYWKLEGVSQGADLLNMGMQVEIRGCIQNGNQCDDQMPVTEFFSKNWGSGRQAPDQDGLVLYKLALLGNDTFSDKGVLTWTKKYLYLRPWNIPAEKKVYFGIQLTGGVTIGSGITTIESIGKIHSTKRKLYAEVDRKSGELSGTFDFLLYGGEKTCRKGDLNCP